YEYLEGNKILVKDTIQTLRNLGRIRLSFYKRKKIAVTGSFGKTGVKDALCYVLKEKYNTCATAGNHNNELGVCLTASGIPLQTEMAVFEIGSNAPGEIEHLSNLIKPDMAVVTGVGFAHIGRFGTLEETAKEKLSIANSLSDGGTLIVNSSLKELLNKFYSENRFKAVTFGEEGADISLTDYKADKFKARAEYSVWGKDYAFELPYPYRHLAVNFGAVLGGALLLNLSEDEIKRGVSSFRLADGRGNILKGGDLYVIDDSYNASLESVLRSVEALNDLPISGEKYAVLGGIGEIDGFDTLIYKKVCSLAEECPRVNFIFVGDNYAASFERDRSNAEFIPAMDAVTKRISAIEKGVILLKASHSFGFSRFKDEINKRVGLNVI
ncbi:MAG: UDP-N-acetylmuramoyl-tripeptide--D-alanyl-D-alanine ligase, partial [Deferribacteraceae bacterium]|nr:UDP-N-acetylmuramoyl-tripeptide--D-alanyl-D-alanine ligase [Deferribacteraceae bacterium]